MTDDRPNMTELRVMARLLARPASYPDNIWPPADEVMQAALRALQESETIIARQRAELDSIAERTVYHCMERDLDDVMVTCMGEPDGVMIRTTDTGREFELTGRMWRERIAR